MSSEHSGSGDTLNLFYSTSATINKLYPNSLRVPVLTSAEIDTNNDGKIDKIDIIIKMPITLDERITGIDVLVYCDVVLDTKTKLLFDAVSLMSYQSASPMSKLVIDGDFILRQTWPLGTKGG